MARCRASPDRHLGGVYRRRRGFTMQIHPLAKKVPPLTREEFQRLRESVASGFDTHTPIITHEGMVLDGRHRLRACEEEGVKPVFEKWRPINKTDSPAKFVIRRTIHRQMTHAQRAALAADILPTIKQEAEQRAKSGKTDVGETGRATDIAARAAGTNRNYVEVAEKVRKEDPAMFKAMKKGEVSIAEAKAAVAPPPRPAPKVRSPIDKALAAVPTFKELINKTNALRRDVEALTKTEPGAELALVGTRIKTALDQLADDLKFKAPHAACPYGPNCEVGCKCCKGRRWISLAVWNALPPEFKK